MAATNIVMAINVVKMVQKRSVQVRSACGTGNCCVEVIYSLSP